MVHEYVIIDVFMKITQLRFMTWRFLYFLVEKHIIMMWGRGVGSHA